MPWALLLMFVGVLLVWWFARDSGCGCITFLIVAVIALVIIGQFAYSYNDIVTACGF